jgi:hypothetical protein
LETPELEKGDRVENHEIKCCRLETYLREKEWRGENLFCQRICRIQNRKNPAEAGFKIGRRERIRTSDPLVPNQLRYQAALLADVLLFEFLVQFFLTLSCGARGGT